MYLKVCGMKYPDNASAVAALQPDYMGFIFYKTSKRYCGDTLTPAFVQSLPDSIIKTGVFVDESEAEVLRIVKAYGFKAVQLHGHESPAYCKAMKSSGLQVIKAFHIDETFDWKTVEPYESIADFFLFDTKTEGYGGSGKRFNIDLLKGYNNKVPVFLSGGIDEGILNELNGLTSVNIYALDINSRFETGPGLKDVERIRLFKQALLEN